MSSRWKIRSTRTGRKAEHADLYLEGSDQHRGWFQSSLLESVRHARPRALQGRADPRLRAGRPGPQNVQVAGQHAGAAGDRGKERRGHLAPVGGVLGLHRRSAHRPGHHQGQCRSLSPPAQHHPLHAGQSGGLRREGAHRASTRCRSWNASCWPSWPSSMRRCARAMPRSISTASTATLFNFCTNELSAFYFDIRKDALYCDAAARHAPPRRAHRDGRNFPPRRHLVRADPVLHHGRGLAVALSGEDESVHLQTFPETPAAWTQRRADREMEAHPHACAASSPARWKSRAATR